MKKQGIKITIAEPCHENWNAMLPEEKGKFCLACKKTVVDFSVMSDSEIIDFLSKSSGAVCGRINEERLNTPIRNYVAIKSGFFNKYIAGFLMALGLYPQWTSAQQSAKPKQELKQKEKNETSSVKKPTGPMTIKGKVLDSKSKKVLDYADIRVQGTHIHAIADENGNYSIEIPEELRNKQLVVIISMPGYADSYLKNIDITRSVYYAETYMKKEKDQEYIKMGKMIVTPEKESCGSKK